MSKSRKKAPTRRMKSIFLIFCEGETEETYLSFLRNTFEHPMKIISKVEGGNISQRLIDMRRNELKITSNDVIRVFLMYDMDVPQVTKRLKSCNAEMLLSNPCIELWFILHSKEQLTPITTENAIKALKKLGGSWGNYEKPKLSDTQRNFLKEHTNDAIARAKSLQNEINPSSGIYKLLDAMNS